MNRYETLERRIEALEECNEALMGVVNHLLECVYDKRFIGKLERIIEYGKGNGEKGDTVRKAGACR